MRILDLPSRGTNKAIEDGALLGLDRRSRAPRIAPAGRSAAELRLHSSPWFGEAGRWGWGRGRRRRPKTCAWCASGYRLPAPSRGRDAAVRRCEPPPSICSPVLTNPCHRTRRRRGRTARRTCAKCAACCATMARRLSTLLPCRWDAGGTALKLAVPELVWPMPLSHAYVRRAGKGPHYGLPPASTCGRLRTHGWRTPNLCVAAAHRRCVAPHVFELEAARLRRCIALGCGMCRMRCTPLHGALLPTLYLHAEGRLPPLRSRAR
jgi:hypothetical protein